MSMVSDLCRLYHYTIEQVLAMPMKRASFLWGRGVSAERMQAYRIAGMINGKNIDAELEAKEERKRVYLSGKPSKQGQAIIDAIMGKPQ